MGSWRPPDDCAKPQSIDCGVTIANLDLKSNFRRVASLCPCVAKLASAHVQKGNRNDSFFDRSTLGHGLVRWLSRRRIAPLLPVRLSACLLPARLHDRLSTRLRCSPGSVRDGLRSGSLCARNSDGLLSSEIDASQAQFVHTMLPKALCSATALLPDSFHDDLGKPDDRSSPIRRFGSGHECEPATDPTIERFRR